MSESDGVAILDQPATPTTLPSSSSMQPPTQNNADITDIPLAPAESVESTTAAPTTTAAVFPVVPAADAAISHGSPAPIASISKRTVFACDVIKNSQSYINFRANVPLQRMSVGSDEWRYYDFGPKTVPPIICICGTSGTAECFFYQILSLGSKGFRIISAQPPAYYSIAAWFAGLEGFLDAMKIDDVHLFGISLGGYLALHFTAKHPHRVRSLVLCNAFSDAGLFVKNSYYTAALKYAPDLFLRGIVESSFPKESYYPDAVDFIVDHFNSLPRDTLAARLTLNYTPYTPPSDWHKQLNQTAITIIDPTDDVALPQILRERLYQLLPDAKYALLKNGGDFPILSVPDEVNMLLQVHMRTNGIFPSNHDDELTQRPYPNDVSAEQSSSSPPSMPNVVSVSANTVPTPRSTMFLSPSATVSVDYSASTDDDAVLSSSERDDAAAEKRREADRILLQQDAARRLAQHNERIAAEQRNAAESMRIKLQTEKAREESTAKRIDQLTNN